MSLIDATSASLIYSDQGRPMYACRGVTLTVRRKEFLGILGPSGSGKSSLLYLLSGLKAPSEGDVTVEGQSLKAMNDDQRSRMRLKRFGFVFQQPYLLGYLNALENVRIAAPQGSSDSRAFELLDRLGLGEKWRRRPHELSGGERQRVCVARALLAQPQVIFADEPTASLDHKNGEAVVSMLNQHRADGSLVMVTHDVSMLAEADRIVHLVDGELQEAAV
ncbi:MAG TPA: ATP-binding cassette domain-containing protein [Fimbriimonas sp.]|nr:ATP-binding cassette domain-containing protein [Fimbriimonas sp.]